MLCQNQVNDALLNKPLLGFLSDIKTWLTMLVSACRSHAVIPLTRVLVHISSFDYTTSMNFKCFISAVLPHSPTYNNSDCLFICLFLQIPDMGDCMLKQ